MMLGMDDDLLLIDRNVFADPDESESQLGIPICLTWCPIEIAPDGKPCIRAHKRPSAPSSRNHPRKPRRQKPRYGRLRPTVDLD